MNNLENEFTPSIERLKTLIEERALELQNKINDYSNNIEAQGLEFNNRLEELANSAKVSIDNKVADIDSIVNNITEKIDSLLSEKNNQFEELKSNYESISLSLIEIRENISNSINDKISEANSIIEESLVSVEENSKEKYEQFIARLNSNLEQTIYLLMNDAKEFVQKAKEDMIEANLGEYNDKLENMKGIVEALEADISKYASEIDARLEEINLTYEDKTNIILQDLETRTDALTEKLNDTIVSIDNMLDEKTSDISSEYDILKSQANDIAHDIEQYMETVKVFDKAEEMAEFIKEDVSKLAVLVEETKSNTVDMNKTISEFNNLKDMYNEILEYYNSIESQRDSLRTTQEQVSVLMEMSEDIQNKFITISESNTAIENTQEGIQVVIDIASQIEEKLNIIKDKEEYADNILDEIRRAEVDVNDVLAKVESIRSSMDEAKEIRKEFMEKVYSLERDMEKVNKSDKKVQTFLSKLEELHIIIEEMGIQRENLRHMKTQYDQYNDTVTKNLERAEYFVRYLETLLSNADQYLGESAKPTSKRLKSNDDRKKTEIIIKLYKEGWKPEDIVKNTSYSIDEVSRVINKWKDDKSKG